MSRICSVLDTSKNEQTPPVTHIPLKNGQPIGWPNNFSKYRLLNKRLIFRVYSVISSSMVSGYFNVIVGGKVTKFQVSSGKDNIYVYILSMNQDPGTLHINSWWMFIPFNIRFLLYNVVHPIEDRNIPAEFLLN